MTKGKATKVTVSPEEQTKLNDDLFISVVANHTANIGQLIEQGMVVVQLFSSLQNMAIWKPLSY